MNSNFCFLKKVDNDLYKIITDAEKLYRDEYFEQCIAQTRKFGENICRKTLGYSCDSFDEMLANLKDKSSGEEFEKEFLNDLYFLKREGNKSVHSKSVKQDGIKALECLQRAFEVSLNFSVFQTGADSKLLKRRFDTELLVTGQKSKKTLTEKYLEEKEKNFTKRPKVKKTSKSNSQVSVIKSEMPDSTSIPIYWYFVGFSFVMAFIAMIVISL